MCSTNVLRAFLPCRFKKCGAFFYKCLILVIAICSCVAQSSEFTEQPTHAGMLSFRSSQHSSVASTHVSTKAKIEVTGMIVSVTYNQTFVNNSDDWVEGIYTFPLPQGAALKHMEFLTGNSKIVATIHERKQADLAYKKALKSGKQAALTTQQRPNLFTQKIANIPPNEKVEVTLKFIDIATYKNNEFVWRLPTTLTPRYIPGEVALSKQNSDESALEINNSTIQSQDLIGWAFPTNEVPDAHLITPPINSVRDHLVNPISIDVKLNSGMPLANISSLYHDIYVQKNNRVHEIHLQNDIAEMDRDFVLTWRPTVSSQPVAASFQQEKNGEYYSMLMLLPPTSPAPVKLIRDVLFIIDTSGSMQGESIQFAKQSLQFALSHLSNNDRFNILSFNDSTQPLFPSLKLATVDKVKSAHHWINTLDADGGTNMQGALNHAFKQMGRTERLQQIVFITDGAIGNEEALFNLIENQVKNARLFPVGIGSAPNMYFMTKAAQVGHGTYEHIARTEDIQPNMNQLFAKLNQTIATNINIARSGEEEVFPTKIPDLFLGEPIVYFSKSTAPRPDFEVSGSLADTHWTRTILVDPKTNTAGIATMWARKKIAALEEQGRTGVLSKQASREAIIEASIKYQVLSRFTAFLAVSEEVKRPDTRKTRRDLIANKLPKGQKWQPIPMASTATTAHLSFILGLVCLVMAGCIRFIRQRQR